MKLRLNKLVAGLVLAGSVVALVGCGGGDEPTLVVKQNAVTTVSASTLPQTKAIVNAASGTQFSLPSGLNFPNATSGNSPATAPNNAVLEIQSKPNATGNELGAFSMSAGPDDKMDGVIETGSCKFKVTNITGTAFGLLGWKVGDTYTQTPCAITLETAGQPASGTIEVPLLLTLGAVTLTGNATVEIVIEPSTDGGVSVKVGDTVVTEQPLPTGGTPS